MYYAALGRELTSIDLNDVAVGYLNLDNNTPLNVILHASVIPHTNNVQLDIAMFDGLNGTGNRLTGLYTTRFSGHSTSTFQTSNVNYVRCTANSMGNLYSSTTNDSVQLYVRLINVGYPESARDDAASRRDYSRTIRGQFTTSITRSTATNRYDYGFFQHRFLTYDTTFFPTGVKSIGVFASSGNLSGIARLYYD